jgi:hypothetical protein
MTRILCTLLLLLGFSTASLAQQVPDSDASEFERIITEQLKAFKADDGPRAYSFAAPNIQMIFPSPELFMGMVMKGYPQVYRPKSYKFTGAMIDPAGRPSQKVLFIGPDGKAYTALYTMEKQPDGSWKIAACTILREVGLDA